MLKPIKSNSGVYLLELFIDPKEKLPTKRFDRECFPEGYYYYAGSAQKNLIKRIERHLRHEKTIHWHIDHLTTGTDFIKRIFIFENAPKNLECDLVQLMLNKLSFGIPVKNFGNGDCVNNCPSHLLYSGKSIDQSQLFSLYHSIVCLIPSSSGTF